MINEDFFDAIDGLAKEKGIPVECFYDLVKESVEKIMKTQLCCNLDGLGCFEADPEKKDVNIYIKKTVVKEISSEERKNIEITLDEAKEYNAKAKLGDIINVPISFETNGRIISQSVKHLIRQNMTSVMNKQISDRLRPYCDTIVTARVLSVDSKTGNATVEIGKMEVLLPKKEQIPGEVLHVNDVTKVYILKIRDTERGPKVMISRTHKEFVRKLFEIEVPEIADGTVEIKEIAREEGSRTKMAVYSADENVDAVGACIGPRGARVAEIVDLLGGEKIDIVPYSDDPAKFVAAALAPADVLSVEILEPEIGEKGEKKNKCRATVPDTQLSLAIGNGGQNAKLAAQLTNWKIDIRPESGFYGETEE